MMTSSKMYGARCYWNSKLIRKCNDFVSKVESKRGLDGKQNLGKMEAAKKAQDSKFAEETKARKEKVEQIKQQELRKYEENKEWKSGLLSTLQSLVSSVACMNSPAASSSSSSAMTGQSSSVSSALTDERMESRLDKQENQIQSLQANFNEIKDMLQYLVGQKRKNIDSNLFGNADEDSD